MVKRAFATVIENSMIQRSQIAAESPFNPEDIEQLANLPFGYLDEDSAYSWAIRELNSGFTS